MSYVRKIIWTGMAGLLAAPVLVLAQPVGGPKPPSTELKGPIDAENVAEVLNRIIDALLLILSPIAVIMAIYAGFLFMTAGDNEEKVKAARHTLLYVLVGVAVLILSKGVVTLVESIIG